MNKIKILLSAFFIFSLGFALIACEEEKTEKTEKNEESAFKFGTVESPVSDGTLCINWVDRFSTYQLIMRRRKNAEYRI